MKVINLTRGQATDLVNMVHLASQKIRSNIMETIQGILEDERGCEISPSEVMRVCESTNPYEFGTLSPFEVSLRILNKDPQHMSGIDLSNLFMILAKSDATQIMFNIMHRSKYNREFHNVKREALFFHIDGSQPL